MDCEGFWEMGRKKTTKQNGESLEQNTETKGAEERAVITKEIVLEQGEQDLGTLLDALRAKDLKPTELMRICQQLAPHELDVAQIILDEDDNFVVNFLAFLQRRNYWHEAALRLVFSERELVADAALSYIQRMLRQNPLQVVDFMTAAKTVLDEFAEKAADYKNFVPLRNELRAQVSASIVTMGLAEPPANLQNLFTALHMNADEKLIYTLLFDGSIAIRRATVKMLTAQKDCSVGLLSSTLVLLKDSDEQVQRLVLSMALKHACFPELIIPQIFNYMMTTASEDIETSRELIQKFENDAIPTVMTLLASTNSRATGALYKIMRTTPLRWVEPLINAMLSYSSPEHAAERASELLGVLLHELNDVELKKRIEDALEEREFRIRPKDPVIPKAPRVELKTNTPLPLDGFDSRPLTDKELKKLRNKVELEDLLTLLNDGRDVIKLNAVNLARVQNFKDPNVVQLIAIHLHLQDPTMINAVLDALVALSEPAYYLPILLRQYDTAPLLAVRTHALERLQSNEARDLMMAQFREEPTENYELLKKLLQEAVGEKLLPHIMDCVRVDEAHEVVENALRLLITLKADSEPIRKHLIELVKEKCYYNESVKRRRALYLLKRMKKDEETIEFLLGYVKHIHNMEIKKIILSIFKTFDVDYFEDDEEEDDFGDF
jgi:hypothetical protein